MTKALAATLFAALVLIPAAGTHGIKEGGTFRVGMGGGISSIDPVTTAPVILTSVTCAGLMRLDGLRVVPEIAADFPKLTNGGKTYTFTIRKEARFSTGSPVTARSFVHTINRLLNPTMQSPSASYFDDILGARKVIDGKSETASGIVARGRELIIRLKQPVGDLPVQLTRVCVVPESTPIDPEGVKAPAPSAGPYYFAEFDLGVRVVLERNRYYRGDRPHHVDRFTVDLSADVATVLDRVDRGELDWGAVSTQNFATRADEFRRKYGINKSRFWVMPANNLRMFVLNTSGPLFRNNPKLRQAVNFAVDRRRLRREFGPFAGTLTDQYLPPGLPGFRNERIYPLNGPDLKKAKQLAKGHTRSGKAVLYVPANPVGDCPGGDRQGQPEQDRARGRDQGVSPGPVHFGKLATPGEPFDIAWIGWLDIDDGSLLNDLFDGRTIGQPDSRNYSYFDVAEIQPAPRSGLAAASGPGALPRLRRARRRHRQ